MVVVMAHVFGEDSLEAAASEGQVGPGHPLGNTDISKRCLLKCKIRSSLPDPVTRISASGGSKTSR